MAQMEQPNANQGEEEKKSSSEVKVLVIDKGFGGSLDKMRNLKARFGADNVRKVIVAEPSDKTFPQAVEKLTAEILAFKPNVIIASSRGGYYASSLLHSSDKELSGYIGSECTLLLLSAMDTQRCNMANKAILLYHAAKDGINNIDNVKQQCASYPLSKLIIADNDTHSLESLKGEQNAKICELVLQSVEWLKHCQVKENREKLLSQVDSKLQKKTKNRFDLLSQINAKNNKK